MSDVTWTVTSPNGEVKRVGNAEKIPYIPQQKTNDQMTDGQKEFIRQYNLMRTTLIKNGLMEEKQ